MKKIQLKRESWGYSYKAKNGDMWSIHVKQGNGWKGWWNVDVNNAPCDSIYGLAAVRDWIAAEEFEGTLLEVLSGPSSGLVEGKDVC
jgi:hypothetical protein